MESINILNNNVLFLIKGLSVYKFISSLTGLGPVNLTREKIIF